MKKTSLNNLLAQFTTFKWTREDLAATVLAYLWQIARRQIYDDDLADEVAQKACPKVFDNIYKKEPPTGWTPQELAVWLNRIVRNVIVDSLRELNHTPLQGKLYKRWVIDFLHEVVRHQKWDLAFMKQVEADLLKYGYQEFQRLTYSDPLHNVQLEEIQSEHRSYFAIQEESLNPIGPDGEEEESKLTDEGNTETAVLQHEQQHCLWLLVNTIQHPDRRLEIRYIVEATLLLLCGLGRKEISETLGLSSVTVGNDLAHQIRPQIQKQLADGFYAAQPQCQGCLDVVWQP